MNTEHKIEELLQTISSAEKYNGCVFWGPGIYFVIWNGSIWEISNDAGCSPRGGWFPPIVTGPLEEETNCLDEMMKSIGFDESFFNDIFYAYDEFSDEYAVEYFEENEDEKAFDIYQKIKDEIESGRTPFTDIEDMVSVLSRYELEPDILYYEWEGEFIDFYDNIVETGEGRGRYDRLDDSEWIEILNNIDKHIVTAD